MAKSYITHLYGKNEYLRWGDVFMPEYVKLSAPKMFEFLRI